MAGEIEDSNWPMPKFRFEVDFGEDAKIAFQEVSGMDKEVQIIEYRHSNSPVFSTIKMPGISKHGNVTMKRGVFAKDNKFWDWMKEISMNTIKRRTVLIKLLDENGDVTMLWSLQNAWPTKVTSTDLKSDGNEVAVDTIEIVYETMVVTNKAS